MAYQGPALGRTTAQEEEDRRLAEKKKAEEEKKAAEEAARKKAEEEARARKEADMIGAQHAEMLSQKPETKNAPTTLQVNAPETRTAVNSGGASAPSGQKKQEEKPENDFKTASDTSFMQEKKEMAEIKGKPEGMSAEEIYRLLYLDEEETQKHIDELKAGRHDYGGTAAAVAAGRNSKSPMAGTAVNYDEGRENEIANLERDLLLHGQLQKEYEYFDIQSSSEKMEAGAKGYGQWISDQKAAEERKQEERAQQGNLEKYVLNSWDTPDMSIPSGNFAAAVNAYKEDTSENEPNDQWTTEQKYTFGYLYSIGDYAGAAEYARRINNAYRNAENQKIIDDFNAWAMKNGGTKFVADVGSVVTAGLDGVNYLDALAQQTAQGYITESTIPLPGDFRNAYRNERAEELNNKYGTLGNTDIGLGTGYSIVMSSLDSMATAYTGGKPGALITAFGSSASAALDDALERGASAEQALGYATLVGGAELLPEYMSVDSLFKLMDAGDVWTLIGNIGRQAGTEGVEGFITAVSAQGVDDVIMGELSKFNVAVNNYMLAGHSREEAEYLARKDIDSGIIFDTISEALGGGFSGGVVTGVQTAINGNRNGNASVLDVVEPTVPGKPEAAVPPEIPVPFGGNAEPGTEQGMVGDKIAEIENRPISDADKAAKMDEVINAVAETTGSPEVIAEAETFKKIYEERAAVSEMQQETAENAAETQQGLFGPDIIGKILGFEDPETQAQMDEVSEIGNKLGIEVAFSRNIVSDGIHTEDGRIVINPDTERPLRQVLIHELTHEIETSGFYGELSQKILDYAVNEQGANLETMRADVREDYLLIGKDLSDPVSADREIVAKFAEQYLFTDENSINRLCNTNPSLFQKIRYWISDMIVKFRGTSEEQFLRNAEKLYAKAWATRGQIPGAGVEQASIANVAPYGDVVYLDTTLYDGLTDAERKEMVKARVKELGGQTFTAYDQNGNAVDIKIVTSKRFKNRRGKTTPANNDLRTKFIGDKTKQEAIDLIDELVLTSTFDGTDSAKHPHDWIDNNGKNDWEKWKTYLIDKNNTIWEARLNVATSANGERILYDIDPIKKVGQAGNSATSSPINNVPQKTGNVNGQNNSQNNTPAFGRSYGEMLDAQNLGTEQREATPSMKRADGKKTAEDWKGIAERIGHYWGIKSFKDLPRILDTISDGDKGLRQQLYELYEKPLNEAQGSYAKEYTEKAKQITAKFKELGIKSGSKESAAVQRIGEGAKEINKRGETVEYTLDDLKKDFPDSWQNIKEGADFCRKVYDEFLHDLNTMYESIYPATVEQARDRISSYDKGILRDESKIEHFREVITNLEAQKAEKQTQLSGKKPTTLIYAQIQSQIDNIDGRIAKAESIIGRLENRELVKKISRETLNAQIENGEILRNKQIKPRADYFRHFQELTNEFAEIADIFSNDQRIPPNLAGKSADTKPRTIWTSIAQSRANTNYYTEDAVGGLLRYTEIAEKLLAFDPLISHFRDVNSAIRAAGEMAENEVKGKGTNAGQFVSHMDAITNQLAGKTNPWFDRLAADYGGDAGRAVLKAVKLLNRRVKSNAILGNFRSAIVQIGNLPNATLYIQNPADWAKGAVTMLNGFERDENIKNARAQSNFMNRRYMGDAIDEVTKEIQNGNIFDKPKEFAIWMLGAGDRFGAELIWHTAYTKALNNPAVLEGRERGRAYESAIDYADDTTRRSIGGRAEGDIPLAEESQIIGLVAPFQIEVTNTFNAFKEGFKDKNWVGLAAFEISIFFMNNLLEGITGDRPLGLDFIQAALDIWFEATGEDDEEEEEKDFGDYWDIATYAGGRFGGELLSGMPLGAQVADWITGGDEQKAEDWFGDSDPTRYGTGNIGMDAIADAAEYFIDGETPGKLFELATDGKKNSYEEWAAPVLETVDTFAPIALPWGGKQLSRTLQGIDQIIQGGAYGTEADGTRYLKFLQGDDLEDFYKVLLFGRYAGEGGQEYIDSGFSTSLSGKQTEQMKLAEQWGISNEKFHDLVIGLRDYGTKEEKLLALMDNENFTTGEKGILEHILFGDARKPYDTRDYSGMEEFYISGLSDTEKRLYEQGFYGGELDKLEKAIKSGGNKGEKIENIMETLDVSETEAFEILQKRNGDWIETAEDLSEEDGARAKGAKDLYGMSTEDYIATVNAKNFGGDSKEETIEGLMAMNGWDRETAEENYNRVFVYEYSRDDISEERAAELGTAQDWYDVDDYGYFVARNAIKTAEGEKDKYGNTVSGSVKAEAITNIAKQLGIDEEEAAVYYLAAKGELILSIEDLTSSHREALAEAKKYGWTEMQYINAVNIVKLLGNNDSKANIIAALVAAGATYEMAYGYYNLQQNNDYYKR